MWFPAGPLRHTVAAYYKARLDPFEKAMNAWNALPVLIRNAETKAKLKVSLRKNSIVNPYLIIVSYKRIQCY